MKVTGPVDWDFILWASVIRGPLAGGSGPKPMVPPMPPFFLLREGNLPRLEKENVCDWLSVGNSELLMFISSNAPIIGEFSNFLVSHLMRAFGFLLRLSIKGMQGGGFLCTTSYCWLFREEVNRYQKSYSMIANGRGIRRGFKHGFQV